jgi:hypothetical protein
MADDNSALLVAGAAVIGAAVWLVRSGSGLASGLDLPELPTDLPSEITSFVPTSFGGEVGVSDNGVVYDDPERGSQNDEAGDDSNVSFDAVNSNDTTADDTDPTTYAPDVVDGSTAPSSGVLADAGGSQYFGSAGEQENDDLTERSANSNMDDDTKSAFDRLANYDDPEQL